MQTAELIEKIDAFIAKFDMAPSTFGLKAANCGHLINRLRTSTRGPYARTVEKVVTYIDEAEKAHLAELADALMRIKARDGYVQVTATGEPLNLPAFVKPEIFHALVESGQLAPSGDGLIDGHSQTYRPI